MKQIISITKGTDRTWNLQLRDSSGNIVTTYTDSDVLVASVWAGLEQAVLFSPTCTWTDPTQGEFTLSIAASQTADIDPDQFNISVTIETTTNLNVDAWQGWLKVNDTSGSAASLSTYATLSDALPYAPWLEKLQTEQDAAGFTQHFHNARTWLEEIIQSKYRLGGFSGITAFGFPWVNIPVYDVGVHNVYLQSLLDTNKLMLHPTIIQVTAFKAIAYICDSCVSPDSKDSNYQDLAAKFHSRADGLVKGMVADIDINDDGYADIGIHLGTVSTRFG